MKGQKDVQPATNSSTFQIKAELLTTASVSRAQPPPWTHLLPPSPCYFLHLVQSTLCSWLLLNIRGLLSLHSLAPAITSWSEIAPPVCLFVYYLSSPPGCRPSDGDRQCLPPHSCIPSNPGLSLAHGKHQTHFFEWMNKWISERFPAKHNRTKQTILPIKPRLISANFHFTSWQWTTGITSIWFYRLL